MTLETVTTQQVATWAAKGGVEFIDVRSPDAYNGWCLGGELRGGHIPGARSLPAKWAAYIDWLDIVRSKGIEPGATVVLYGDADEDLQTVARLFLRAGFKDVRVYRNFTKEWSPRAELPMDRLARYAHLVPPEWVHALPAGAAPQGSDTGRTVICHCHYGNAGDYEEGHIPGAISLDTLALESPETWNRRTPDELREALEEHGIAHDTTVILYGRDSSPGPNDAFPGKSAGHLAAMRCAFLLMYAGVEDVRVLNGGLRSWQDARLPVSSKATVPARVAAFGLKIPAHPEIVLDTPEVKELLASQDGYLVGMRSRSEFEGKVSGYNYIEAKGRIPGEIFGNCGRDAYHMDNFRNPDSTTLEYPQIAAALKAAGIVPGKQVVFFCGTGWRASEAFYNTWLMGWEKIAVYDG
ncbi:MAG: thiosulfate sulfurtransferase, partial [Chromatiales bacterium 21-64-14]